MDLSLQASGLASKGEESQVSALVYATSNKADEILHSCHLSEDDAKKYSRNFEAYFVKKWVRAKFNQRIQQLDEPVDSFITDLHTLVKFYNNRALHNQLIHNRMVFEIESYLKDCRWIQT